MSIKELKLKIELNKIKKRLKKLINKPYASLNSDKALDKMLNDIKRAYGDFIYGAKAEHDEAIALCMQKSCVKDYGDKNNYFTYQIKKFDNANYDDDNFYIYYTIEKKVNKRGYKRFYIKDFEFVFK